MKMLICRACGVAFAARVDIAGQRRSLHRRRFCLACSPFGAHNTSKSPIAVVDASARTIEQRRRRNASTYRYQKRRRRDDKRDLVLARGGRCADCGYSGAIAALEFHHREANDKLFTVSASTSVSRARLAVEVAKCDLVCANCHRLRHARAVGPLRSAVARSRKLAKTRAVEVLGGRCAGCREGMPMEVFEFHHVDGRTKEFGISEDGVARSWSRITSELAKCVLLCANCHREVHARVRDAEGGLLGLAEAPAQYIVCTV